MEWQAGWQDAFEEVLRLCRVQPGEPVAVLAETLSRPVNLHLAEAALHRLGARPVRVTVPSITPWPAPSHSPTRLHTSWSMLSMGGPGASGVPCGLTRAAAVSIPAGRCPPPSAAALGTSLARAAHPRTGPVGLTRPSRKTTA